MTETAEQIGALSRAIYSVDAARRVGWAKAYSAEASKDQLSHDVNILRMERDVMRRAASFLYGFLLQYLEIRGDNATAKEALGRWSTQVGAVLDSEVSSAGRDAARSVVAVDAARAEAREAKNRDKKAGAKDSRRMFTNAREQERRLLMKRYGIPNEAALFNWLEQYPS